MKKIYFLKSFTGRLNHSKSYNVNSSTRLLYLNTVYVEMYILSLLTLSTAVLGSAAFLFSETTLTTLEVN